MIFVDFKYCRVGIAHQNLPDAFLEEVRDLDYLRPFNSLIL